MMNRCLTWDKKWCTGKEVKIPMVFRPVTGTAVHTEVDGLEYSAPLGDLIKGYIEHLQVRKFRRGFDWEFTEKDMREVLNQASFIWQK